MFEVGRAEGRQLHQERELLHVAFHSRQAFHNVRRQSSRQDACDIEDEQRQPLQVENPAHRAVGNDGGDNQRVHGQPRGAGQQRGDGDGNEAFARVVNRARRHHGGNGAGETRQERDERASGQAAFRHHVIQQERRARQVAGIFQKQDEGEQNRNLRQEHQHAAGTGNHAVDEQVVEDARRHIRAHPFAQRGKAALDGVHNRRRPSVNRLEHHKQDDQQQNHTQHRMQHDVVQFLMPCRQRHFRADDLCQNRFDFLIKLVALQRIKRAFGRGGAGRERAFARQLGHRLAHRVYTRRAHCNRFQNRYAQQLAQFGRIDIQAPFSGNVAHVQRHHHR